MLRAGPWLLCPRTAGDYRRVGTSGKHGLDSRLVYSPTERPWLLWQELPTLPSFAPGHTVGLFPTPPGSVAP